MTLKFGALLLLFISTLGWVSPGWGDAKNPESHFSLVQGSVKVVSGGGTVRKVAVGDTVYPGETVQVGSKSQAQVTLFDSSTLDLSADTKITLSKLQQPSSNDKVISMKLALGRVFAQVKKLFSAKSTFEIEAGGVVCGVRGTAFSMDFDPKSNKLDLNVFNGKVSATNGGNTLFFGAGQHCHFLNGQATGTGGGSNNNGTKNSGKGGTNGGNSNGTGGNNSGSNSNGGTSSSNSNGGNGTGSNENNGGTNGNGNNTQEGSNSAAGNNPPNPGNPSPGLDTNTCLGDLNNQFTQGILINGDNNLSSAQQTVNIHLVVPAREAVP